MHNRELTSRWCGSNIPIEREGLEAAKNMIIDKSNVSNHLITCEI